MLNKVVDIIKLDYNTINNFLNKLHKLVIYITTVLNFMLFISLIFFNDIALYLLRYIDYINFYKLNFNQLNIIYKILVFFYIISKFTLFLSLEIFFTIGKYRELKNPRVEGDKGYINYVKVYAKAHNAIMFSFIHRFLEILIIPFFIFHSILYKFNILDNYLFYYNNLYVMHFVVLFLMINSILSFRYCFYAYIEKQTKEEKD